VEKYHDAANKFLATPTTCLVKNFTSKSFFGSTMNDGEKDVTFVPLVLVVVLVPFGLPRMMGGAKAACSPNDETWSSSWEGYCTVDTWLERKICRAATSNNHRGKSPCHRTERHDVGGRRLWLLEDDDDDDRRAIVIATTIFHKRWRCRDATQVKSQSAVVQCSTVILA